ncbi:MAG: hypothetical protein J6F30_00885 [Cellulosilyticum sp.]|nr:hypothetical protein [Cellulosilyticum sp.]
MNIKKFATLGVIALGIGTFSFSQSYATENVHSSIQKNVVYAVEDNLTDVMTEDIIPGYQKVDPALEIYYISQVKEALDQYYHLSVPEDFIVYVSIVNESNIAAEDAYWSAKIQEEFESGLITNEQFEHYQKSHQNGIARMQNKLTKLNHDYVDCSIYDHEMGIQYGATFNANTKELIRLDLYSGYNTQALTDINSKELETLGAEFIKQHNLGDLKEPTTYHTQLGNNITVIYQDASNPSNKVLLDINPVTKSLYGFCTKSYANMMCNAILNS